MDSDHATDTKKILQDKNLVKSLRYDSQFYKTKLCIFFQSGRCSRKFCKFAHGMEELQRAPDLRKTAMCKNFLATQRCDQEDCTFAHSLDELRATDKFYKTTMCCFYYYGSCKLGELCRHAHSKEELRSLPDVQGLPESLACALLIEQNGRGDSRALPRTPGPQEAEEQLQEIELLRRTVLEVKQQMGKLRHNEPRMAELQRREHQSLNRLQQLTELQTLQRFAATASAPRAAPGAPGAPVPPGGLMSDAAHANPPVRERRYVEQQELQEQMEQLKRQGELQELHQWKLQQQQQMLQQQQAQQLQMHSRLPMNAHFPPDLGYPAMPPSFGTGFGLLGIPDPTYPDGMTGSIDTSLMKMPIMQEALARPHGGPCPGGPGGPGLGLGPGRSGFADASPTRMMEGFPMGQQVGNLNPYSRKVSPPRSNANFGSLNPQAPIGVAMDRQRPQFDTFQRPPPPMQQPPPQPLPFAQPQLPQPQPQPLQPQPLQPQPLQSLQPQLPLQPQQSLQPLAAAGSSQGVAMSDSQKELELLQQQIRYHQHMQKQMQQKVDERMQKLRDMGYNADNLQEEEDEEDDDDSLGPIPGWSREGSLRDPHRKTPMTSPKMLRLEEAGRDTGSQLDQLDEDFDEELGEDPKWVRTRTMPAAVNLKAQAQAQQAAAMAGDRPTPSVASTADTAGRSEKEDPAAEDLGPDPTWNRVHSTPAGSASYAAPQPMFQKGVGMSGAADDAFGPNRRATTMDQVRGRAMAPNMQQGVVPVMMLVPQTMMAPQQMNGGLPLMQSVPLMQGNVAPQACVQGVVGTPVHNVQPQEDLRQMQAQVLQAAMPEIYED